eukprot:TRINITY_DN12573_c1_g1_i1.p1 TRINITY_DN12573_c1_g1~~TRINITY_DN12573_c1_g1_i1.p1  ORF type:complete len:139 (+),score=6.61 TRINITY_DN12573_c1_g1_i1:68-484(+)
MTSPSSLIEEMVSNLSLEPDVSPIRQIFLDWAEELQPRFSYPIGHFADCVNNARIESEKQSIPHGVIKRLVNYACMYMREDKPEDFKAFMYAWYFALDGEIGGAGQCYWDGPFIAVKEGSIIARVPKNVWVRENGLRI